MTTTSPIGQSSAAYSVIDPGDSLTTAGGSLAALVLDTQAIQREASHEQLQAAREDYQAALDEEVSKMHEAAEQVFWGAIAQGSLALAGGAAAVYGTIDQHVSITTALKTGDNKLLECALKTTEAQAFGQALEPLAAPVGIVVSGSNGEHTRAEAKRASGDGEEARWRMDDAKARIEQSEQATERTTEWVATLVDKQDAAIGGVIADFA
jgi:hypothetical protein